MPDCGMYAPREQEMRRAVMRIMRVFGDEPATHEAAYGLEGQLADLMEEWLLRQCGDRAADPESRVCASQAVGIEKIEQKAVGTRQ